MRADAGKFGAALTMMVNMLAAGTAPSYLKPILAGGVSIALQKTETAIRPLACGDPIRRLVGKCFCVAAKDDISEAKEE